MKIIKPREGGKPESTLLLYGAPNGFTVQRLGASGMVEDAVVDVAVTLKEEEGREDALKLHLESRGVHTDAYEPALGTHVRMPVGRPFSVVVETGGLTHLEAEQVACDIARLAFRFADGEES